MPRIDPLRRGRWAAAPSAWPGALTDATFDRLNALVDVLGDPDDLLAACDDPAHHGHAQLVLGLLHRGVAPTGVGRRALAIDGLTVALADAGPVPVPPAIRRALDRVFAGDAWALRLRAPLPDDLDLEPIQRSLRLWRTARTMGNAPSTVNYDHDGVSLEFTVLPPLEGGLPATVGPRRRPPPEPLDAALEGCPEATVVAVRSGQYFGRHALQQMLYGPCEVVTTSSHPPRYEATVEPEGWFPAHRQVAEVWWLDPHPAPFGRLRRLVNPWGPAIATRLDCDRICAAEPLEGGRAVLRWMRTQGG